ncbi:MAG: hypothetical protein Ta2G_05610 [Termitinemataceae bacterium]|nr:MAG: hypothetical protein Ta2G_05610 [Termitinemataceae bacterium]
MMIIKINLKEAFRDAAEAMGTGKSWPQISNEYDRLEKIYKARAYHNFNHIAYCVQLLDDFTKNKISKTVNTKTMLSDRAKQNITLALFYHDVVLGEGGVEASAEEAKKFLSGAKAERVTEIIPLILATKHFENSGDSDSKNSDSQNEVKLTQVQKVMKDLDLSILGSDVSTYKNYTANVRKEYSAFSDAEFSEKRAALIAKFLHGTIYTTAVFSEAFEKNAKQNLSAELESLLKQTHL